MSTPQFFKQKRWQGMSDYPKESNNGKFPDTYYFGRSVNFRDDPQELTLLPGSLNESGSVVTDLLKFADTVPTSALTSYVIGDSGNIYSRTSQGRWAFQYRAANSHGNGLAYFNGDGYVHFANDSTQGRFGPITDVFSFSENWSSGAISPTNWFNWSRGQASVSTQLLYLTSTLAAGFYGIEMISAQNLTGYSVVNQLVSVGSRAIPTYEVYPIYVTIHGDPSNQLFWFIDASNNLKAFKKVAGSNTTLATTTYNAAVHKYFRIREASGTSFFDYSTDNSNWTNFASTTNPFNVTSMTIGMEIGTSTTEATTTSAIFDNFLFAPTVSSIQFSSNFLASQGGVPGNTYSLGLIAASSQYATAADSASLSPTGDITLESFFEPASLPAVGSRMTLIGKWDESTNQRAYKMDIFGISGFFGDSGSGALTISSNTTQAPVDSTAVGATGSTILTATNASFAAGQLILIWQTQGTNAGQWERQVIQAYTSGTITTGTPMLGSYGAGAQVVVIPQYSDITVNVSCVWSAKKWNGTVGGVLVGVASGTIGGPGTINANGKGFNLDGQGGNITGTQGEGTLGRGAVGSNSANGNGGGASIDFQNASPGGGGNGTIGIFGAGGLRAGDGGAISGSASLSTMTFGGQGGGSSSGGGTVPVGGAGGAGGGCIFLSGATFSNTLTFTANGDDGTASDSMGGAGGAGGSILLKGQIVNIGTITASGGAAGAGGPGAGAGGSGIVAIYYLTSTATSGTITPTATTIQDNSLVTTVSYQARLGISNNGTAFEYLTKNLPALGILAWNRLSISWIAATSTASFYLNALSLGTTVGTKTAIFNSTSLLYVGADKDASAVSGFLNGLIDDVRIWGNAQTAGQIANNNVAQLTGNEGGLAAYYKLNNSAADSTPNANNLTLVNSPTYRTDVPFPAATTRLDIDTQQVLTGQTYTLLTVISEANVDTLSFTPVNDPQTSIGFYIAAPGTGDITVVIHDQQNNLISAQTILAANVPSSGFIEFIYPQPWRLTMGKTYHAHLYVSTGTTTVVTGTTANFSTAEYTSYFGFLVPDQDFHQQLEFQYQPLGGTLTGALITLNERYLAVWDGVNYLPNFIVFPPGWKSRCATFWREYMAIGMWRGGNIYDFDKGRIYFWDGIAPTWNFFIDVPEGQINAMLGVDSDLFIFAGYRGNLLSYQGGYSNSNNSSKSSKLRRMPFIANTDFTEVFPGAICMWRGLLHFGLFANSNSTTAYRGTYSYGTYNEFYPDALSFDYPLSTKNYGSSVTIGLVYPVGQSLIVGWRDGVGTGADVVNFNNAPAASGEIWSLYKDDGVIYKEKGSFAVRTDHLPLQSGESIDSKIQIDRKSFITSPLNSTLDTIFTKLPVTGGRGREYLIGADMYATGATSPTLLGLGLQRNSNNEEQSF